MTQKKQQYIEGILKIHNKGKGYLLNNQDNETYFLKRNNLKGALNGDRVQISISYMSLWGFPIVKVIKVVKRGCDDFFAKLYKNKKQTLASLYPFQSKKIIVKNKNHDVEDGDIYQIRITDWRENHRSAYAEIIELKCKSNHPENDYFYYANKYGINSFPKNKKYSDLINRYNFLLEKNIKNRTDLTHLRTFTIDPKNAKDFDDAISIIEKSNNVDLYIHIADVSVFVQENDSVDKNARKRGNSYYFDEKTTHMLPEYLSTNICSLVPNKRRLALTIKIVLDKNMNMKDYSFKETVIKSQRKFSYNEVEKIILDNNFDKFQNELKLLKNVSEKLKIKRLANDGFELNVNKTSLKPDNISKKKYNPQNSNIQSRLMVEECMLLANALAAKQVSSIINGRIKFGLFRNHEVPSVKNELYLSNLLNLEKNNRELKNLNIRAKDLNNFLNHFDQIKRSILCLLIVRKMKKANYSTKKLGHYGLGLVEYTHFTSPIRRYADLIVHRIIKGTFNNQSEVFEIIQSCNEGEIRAQNADREYKTIKGLKFLLDKMKQTHTGYIIKIQRSRIIVSEIITGVDGIILKKSLPNGKYVIDDDMHLMRFRSGKSEFKVGEQIVFRIEKIDLISQQMFLSIADK